MVAESHGIFSVLGQFRSSLIDDITIAIRVCGGSDKAHHRAVTGLLAQDLTLKILYVHIHLYSTLYTKSAPFAMYIKNPIKKTPDQDVFKTLTLEIDEVI